MGESYEAREEEFGAEYADYEGDDIINLARRTGEWLELLLMEEAAVDAAMRVLYERTYQDERPGMKEWRDGKTWRELWSDESDPSGIQSTRMMTALNSFAFFGLRPNGKLWDQDEVEAFVGRARALLDAVPETWGNVGNLRPTVLAAEARLRLDTGRDVTPDQLAALARISLKSVKNMLTPKSGSEHLRLSASGEIRNADAYAWLRARSDFKSSLWRVDANANAPAAPASNTDVGEVVFVPVASDGTWFDPASCRRGEGYTIGAKGAEETISDYRTAVARLERMDVPRWRRPNSAGNWGIVTGVRWDRHPVRDLLPASVG